MEIVATLSKLDEVSPLQLLQEAENKLASAEGEVTVDFSAVRRIDAGVIQAIEQLAKHADDKAVKVAFRGVDVNVYKVLKLVKLAGRFSFSV
jgi:anti-anti-sigma regulatory factor